MTVNGIMVTKNSFLNQISFLFSGFLNQIPTVQAREAVLQEASHTSVSTSFGLNFSQNWPHANPLTCPETPQYAKQGARRASSSIPLTASHIPLQQVPAKGWELRKIFFNNYYF